MDILLLRIAVSTLGLAAGVSAAAQSNDSAPTLDAESLTLDGQSKLAHFRGLKITQGDLSIEAAEALATAQDFRDSEWRLSGGVRIVSESAVLESDTAVFTFSEGGLERGELRGNPASFTDRDPTREDPASGSANKITYDYSAHTVRMSENARIVKGPNEITGCDLIYDFNEERITSGSSDCNQPFRYRSLPRVEDGDADSASAP